MTERPEHTERRRRFTDGIERRWGARPGRFAAILTVALLLVSPALLAARPPTNPARSSSSSLAAESSRGQRAGGAAKELGLPLFRPDDPIWTDPDDLGFPRPAFDGAYQIYSGYKNLFLRPGDRRDLRAANVNTLGEVPDSSWFTNRLGRRDMSVAEIVRGPNEEGVAAGPLEVVGSPSAGISPKLLVRDAAGERFVLKLDVTEYPELASSAELICSMIFHDAGYNVPETYVLRIARGRLRVGDGTSYENDAGEEVEMVEADIDFWLRNSATYPDGSHRILASKFIPGTHVGEFRFHGTRPDDPNDIFPHEHRRELRGYRVLSAWLNHDDSRATNTYDTFLGSPDNGYIKHYLLDFGSCLGSATVAPQKTRGGHEYLFEVGPLLKSLATLGFWHRPWLEADLDVEYSAVGRLEASYFEPELWKPEYPSTAFDNMDAADAFWAARIVARVTDEMIRALVGAADISDPAAAEHLGDLIIARRDKVVAAWLDGTVPLDEFEAQRTTAAEAATTPRADAGNSAVAPIRLTWSNLAVRHGLVDAPPPYDVQWSRLDNRTGLRTAAGATTTVTTQEIPVPDSVWGAADDTGAHYASAAISRGSTSSASNASEADEGPADRPLVVTLRRTAQGVSVVGIRRPR